MKSETGIFVGRGKRGSVTIKNHTLLFFKQTPIDPNRLKQTVWDSTFLENRSPKYLNWEP